MSVTSNIIIMGLAATYITYVVTLSTLFNKVRIWCRKTFPLFKGVFSCPACFSFWAALAVVLSCVNPIYGLAHVFIDTCAVASISTMANLWIKNNISIKIEAVSVD